MAAEALRIEFTSAEHLRDDLNRGGILDGEVEVACVARQGHSPSLVGAVLLFGLVRLMFQGSRGLPRTFVLAVAPDAVAMFRARGMVVDKERYRVTANTVPEARWSRDEVQMEGAPAGITANAVLTVPGERGTESIPCSAPNSQLDAGLEAATRALAD